MDEKAFQELKQLLPEDQISRNPIDLIAYSVDLAPIPESLLNGYGMIGPEVIVRVKSIEEVSKILSFAYQNEIPVTPRGSGSTAVGSVIPIDGGIVMDMNSMRRIIEFNREDGYIVAQPGVEYQRLYDLAFKNGFLVGACPSSAPTATLGGYIATGGGAGIGVARYGTVGEQVISMKVVLPDGRIVQTDPWSSWLFTGSEGTLGVICEVTLKVFPREEMRFFMYGFDNASDGFSALKALTKLRPYYISCLDRGMVRFLKEAHVAHMIDKAITLVVALEGSKDEVEYESKMVEQICAKGFRYREKAAEHEYSFRYKAGLAFKKIGPSLFAQDIRIPLEHIEPAFADLEKLLKNEHWGIESLGGDNESIIIVTQILTDERNKAHYFKNFSYVRDFALWAKKYNGHPFGIGLHNSLRMPDIHGDTLEILRAIKKAIDPKNILNPSKLTQIRMPGYMADLAMLAMKAVPEVVDFGLETSKAVMPASLMRLVLKTMGGDVD